MNTNQRRHAFRVAQTGSPVKAWVNLIRHIVVVKVRDFAPTA